MSLFSELINVYNDNLNQIGLQDESAVSLLPISHTTVKIPIQINIDGEGNFVSANSLEKNEQKTIVPTTIESISRSSGICPMPVDDKLKYVAGDYYQWSQTQEENLRKSKKEDKTPQYHQQYLGQLKAFNDFAQSHGNDYEEYVKQEISAIYKYVTKGNVIHDLMKDNLFGEQADLGDIPYKWSNSKDKPTIYKLATGSPLDSFVRFNVRGVGPTERWHDKRMFQLWIDYYSSILEKGEKGIDYITGKDKAALATMHPKGILPSASNAKLISANDSSNYTYRGRFVDADEAATIGYSESQKAHLALKWLIEKQGFSVGNRYFLAWGSKDLPEIGMVDEPLAAVLANIDDISGTTGQEVSFALKDSLLNGKNTNLSSLLYILELDTSTPGRIDVVYYQALDLESYIDKLSNWYDKTKIERPNSKYQFKNPRLIQIAKMVHNKHAKPEVLRDSVSELVQTILGSQRVPENILMPLYYKAMRPESFDKDDKPNWDRVLETTASLLRTKDQLLSSGLQPYLYDRGYLFGRLMAIAHQIEKEILQKKSDNIESLHTNAQRFMSKLPASPIATWKIVYGRLEYYLGKYEFAGWARSLINQISNELSDDVADYYQLNSPLTIKEAGRFIVGFVHQKNAWYGKGITSKFSSNLLMNFSDREYLFGRLLAIADTTEYKALQNSTDSSNIIITTNANRYLTAFMQQPLVAWQSIYLKLQPYLSHNKYRSSVIKKIELVTNQFTLHQESIGNLNRPLTGSFLVSYSQEKMNIDNGHVKELPINLNEQLDDRSYLYGRLLGLADVVEIREQKKHHIERPTTAERYISAFAQRPAYTWKTIWKNVKRYIKKQDEYNQKLKKLVDRVTEKILSLPNIEKNKNSPLKGQFLLGMSQQKVAWYSRAKERD